MYDSRGARIHARACFQFFLKALLVRATGKHDPTSDRDTLGLILTLALVRVGAQTIQGIVAVPWLRREKENLAISALDRLVVQ